MLLVITVDLLIAVCALEWLVTVMNPFVDRQSSRSSERLPAARVITMIRFCYAKKFKYVKGSEAEAKLTFEGMTARMLLQGGSFRKALIAHIALKGLMSSMRLKVSKLRIVKGRREQTCKCLRIFCLLEKPFSDPFLLQSFQRHS